MALYQIQQEILKCMQGQAANPEILPQKAQDELSVYYSLVVSSLSSLMQNIYPLCYKILEASWNELMIQYQNKYPSKSAIYNKLAADFHKLLAEPAVQEKYNYPNYLSELALYEWTELEIYNAPNIQATTKLTPVHQVLQFTYPLTAIVQYLKTSEDSIEEIQTTDIEEEAQISFFYRDETSLKNRSFVLTPASLFVVQAIGSGKGLEEIHTSFCEQFNLQVDIQAINQLQKDLQAANILID